MNADTLPVHATREEAEEATRQAVAAMTPEQQAAYHEALYRIVSIVAQVSQRLAAEEASTPDQQAA